MMTTDSTPLDRLVEALKAAGRAFNSNSEAPPAAVLWPDHERQWASLVPELRVRLPLLTLGPYEPAAHQGPAFWIRCIVDGAMPDERLAGGSVPIVYLPGYARSDLRAVESCPEALQPLVELQYRGVIWSDRKSKDWTVSAFLQSADPGPGLKLDGSAATREALRLAVRELFTNTIAELKRATVIDAAFLNALLNPDPPTQLLCWLEDPVATRSSLTGEQWDAFAHQCRQQYRFDPEKDGPITAAKKLGERKGNWSAIWNRFADAAANYPGVTALLRKASPPYTPRLLEQPPPWPGRDDPQSSWPGLNDSLERDLRESLTALAGASLEDARARIAVLEAIHGARRDWLWAGLGQAPLVRALAALARLAEAGQRALTGQTVDELAAAYAARGWETDAAAIDALLAVRTASGVDQAAVKGAVEVLYRPWLTELAYRFQTPATMPGGYATPAPPAVGPGSVLLFSDGLRFDIGRRLADELERRGRSVELGYRLAALPTLTPTAKPAVMPLPPGVTAGSDFSPRGPGSQTNLTAESSRKLLEAEGFQILKANELGDGTGRAWTELGAIDAYGHEHGWKVAYHAVDEVRELADRIGALLDWGWARVIVVTDHGWLMLPEPLPKVELPAGLSDPKKGRAARLKPGSQVEFDVVPWHWDPAVRVAIAPGIHCFTAGEHYEHGGLSLQECVTPVLTVGTASGEAGGAVEIVKVAWRGLRCNLTLTAATPALTVDLRRQAGDPASSVAHQTKHPDPDGTAALFVTDEDLDGESVWLVVLAADGTLLAQRETVIGG